ARARVGPCPSALADDSLPNQYPSSWEAGPFGGTPFSAENWYSDWPGHGAVSFSLTGPVPLNGDLSILLTAIAPVVAEIFLFDISGRTILPPEVLELEAGISSFALKTGTLPSGVYIVGVRNMGFLQTAKITVLGTR
ncbi:MAG: hypothetical protein U9P42_05920, partial [Candidatus Fermentibacteria bacterium]|nr:hypothetical protein [Candidatus Fermentibacteria bacterium]